MTRRKTVKYDRPMVALVWLGVLALILLILIGVLAINSVPVPDAAWALLNTIIGAMIGVGCAQVLNGKLHDSR